MTIHALNVLSRNKLHITALKLISYSMLGSCSFAYAASANLVVTSSTEFAAALTKVAEGGTIELKGVSANYAQVLPIKNFSVGSTAHPVVIVNSANLVLKGFNIDTSKNLVIKNFTFASASDSALIKMNNADNVTIQGNTFRHNGVNIKQKSIEFSLSDICKDPNAGDGCIVSHDNDISYNNFQNFDTSKGVDGKAVSANFIQTQAAEGTHIHHNYFQNMQPFVVVGTDNVAVVGGDSGRESVVLGTADTQKRVTKTVIEFNLFEDCDGEDELISVKTSKNYIRYNTFKNSYGSVSLRQGRETQVYSNYFLGIGPVGTNPSAANYETGGIRAYDYGHIIYNNYFQNLTGKGNRRPIVLDGGDTTYDAEPFNSTKHRAANNIRVFHNTFVNNVEGISIESDDHPAQGNYVANNLIVGKAGTLLKDNGLATSVATNIVFPSESAKMGTSSRPVPDKDWHNFAVGKTPAEAYTIDPTLAAVDKNTYALVAPSSGSNAYGYASPTSPEIKLDIDGQTRSHAAVGADDYVAAGVAFKNPPLTVKDVGVLARP